MLYNFKQFNNRAVYLYPEIETDDYFSTGSYQTIIEYFGEVIIQVCDSDYQGDTRVLLKRNGQYGILIFGWGSCSGCDALQACSDIHSLNELIDRLDNDIKWFDTVEQVKEYINSEDRELSYYWHEDEWESFKNQILGLE